MCWRIGAWLPSSKVFFRTRTKHTGKFFFFFWARSTEAHGAKIIARWLASKGHDCRTTTMIRYNTRRRWGSRFPVICIMKVVVQEYIIPGTVFFLLLCCCLLRAWYCPSVAMKSFVTKGIRMWLYMLNFFHFGFDHWWLKQTYTK